MNITKSLQEAKEKSKKRNFDQAMDVIINLTQIDLKNPENKFTEDIVLPAGKGKKVNVGIIGNNLLIKGKESADVLVTENQLDAFAKDAKGQKKLANSVDFLIAEAPFMPKIGKILGRALGSRGKMPKPLPPQADPTPIIKMLKKTVRIKLKETPVLQCSFGVESMKEDELEKNFEIVISSILKKLPAGKNNVKSVYIKTTMGTPVEVKV